MITVISGTNRAGNETVHFAKHIFELLKNEATGEVKFVDLADLPHDWFHNMMYKPDTQSESLAKVQDDCIFQLTNLSLSSPSIMEVFREL